MVEPVFDSKNGVWRCPLCNFVAMSRKVVEIHIQREHQGAAPSQPSQNDVKSAEQPGVNGQKSPRDEKHKSGKEKAQRGKRAREGGGKWKRYRVGNTWVNVLERDEIEIRDMRGWQMFLTANYIAALHRRRVRVKLVDGTELVGILKAKDPYFVTLVLEGGKKRYINKAFVMWIEPVEEDANE